MSMSIRSVNVLFAAIVFLTGSFAAAQTPPSPIKIGGIFILTGEGASTGNASRNGMELAIEEINSHGGIMGRKIVANIQDSRGDPKVALSAFQQLTDVAGVSVIIGPTWSHEGMALKELAARRKILMISPSLGVAAFNESSPYLFNTWPHDEILSRKLADFVYDTGHRRVALIGAEHVWVKEQSRAFRAEFEQRGGTVAYFSEPLPGTTDLRSEALRIKSDPSIDAFVSTTDGVVVGSLVAKALHELNVKLPSFSITLDQAAIDAAQGGFEGLRFLTFLTPRKDFTARYEARFKTPIDIGADSAYDAVMLLYDAMKRTGSTDATELAHELARVSEYRGVSGDLTSDGKRAFTKPFAVQVVRNGMAIAAAES